MPSSHGGGSSGGGSYSSGGGDHSFGGGGSHGFGGGNRGFGGGGLRAPRVSRRAFPGGEYYNYYRRNGRYVGFYCYGQPVRQSIESQIIMLVIIILFLVRIFSNPLINTLSSISLPIKLSSDKVSPTPEYYEDDLGIIKNGESFTEPLKKFFKKTGVQPYVYMFKADEFPSIYGKLSNESLEKYVYKVYVNKFTDEGHFLIVYTQDESGNLWYWCDMSGDDTSGVINQSFWNRFQKDMQRYLNMDSLTPEEAIRITFEESFDYALSWKDVLNSSSKLVLFLLIVAIFAVPQLISIRNSRIINEYLNYEKSLFQDYHSGDN